MNLKSWLKGIIGDSIETIVEFNTPTNYIKRKPISVFKSNDLLLDRMRIIREKERENMLYEDLV